MHLHFFDQGRLCWPAVKLRVRLQTHQGPMESEMRWGYRLWTGCSSNPDLGNDWFRQSEVLLQGADDITENFRVRRCAVPFDFFCGKRINQSPNTDYVFRPIFQDSLYFGGIQSAIDGFAIILQDDGRGWSREFGPGMPTFLWRTDVDRYLNNTTPAAEAHALLQSFSSDKFRVERIGLNQSSAA
jgi:putative SOS response-associated peptidase YedK